MASAGRHGAAAVLVALVLALDACSSQAQPAPAPTTPGATGTPSWTTTRPTMSATAAAASTSAPVTVATVRSIRAVPDTIDPFACDKPQAAQRPEVFVELDAGGYPLANLAVTLEYDGGERYLGMYSFAADPERAGGESYDVIRRLDRRPRPVARPPRRYP
jgi:hypothetical protein